MSGIGRRMKKLPDAVKLDAGDALVARVLGTVVEAHRAGMAVAEEKLLGIAASALARHGVPSDGSAGQWHLDLSTMTVRRKP